MVTAALRQPILRHWQPRLAGKLLIVGLWAFVFSSVFQLFWSVPAYAQVSRVPCDEAYLKTLPVPKPKLHRVVQLVNCSDQTLLGTANAAHNSESPPTAVFPRDKTWVMLPYGSPGNKNVLTIDIPAAWEGTDNKTPQEKGSGPNFWARTGCRYDETNGIALCETGGCGSFYDCSKALKGPPAGATLAEWTFYQQKMSASGTTDYQDFPDISAVNGANLTIDIQPVGSQTTNPVLPNDPQWLAQNYPLTLHGADLRSPGEGLGQCPPDFQLKRSELTGINATTPGQTIFGFVIVKNNGQPQGGDGIVACFSNCGQYEFPLTPSADCLDSEAKCHLWKAFCLNAPASAYGKSCTTDKDCLYEDPITGKKIDYGIACFDNGTTTECAGRGFIKNATCDPNVCTFQYGYLGSKAWQPPYKQWVPNVTTDKSAGIGDDTVHEVMRKAYTWPNDPQVYGGDAPVYRILFAPGGTPGTSPITPSEEGIPLCSSLPEIYGYASQFSGFSSDKCTKPCDGTVNPQCPGFNPPAPKFGLAYPNATTAHPWGCSVDPSSGVGNNGVICRWR